MCFEQDPLSHCSPSWFTSSPPSAFQHIWGEVRKSYCGLRWSHDLTLYSSPATLSFISLPGAPAYITSLSLTHFATSIFQDVFSLDLHTTSPPPPPPPRSLILLQVFPVSLMPLWEVVPFLLCYSSAPTLPCLVFIWRQLTISRCYSNSSLSMYEFPILTSRILVFDSRDFTYWSFYPSA